MLPPRRILVVDDDAIYRRMLFRFLQDQLKWDCISACSGTEGLSKARLQGPDLILLDVRLGDMTGFDVLKQLRDDARTAAIPTIMMSGATESSDILGPAALSSHAKAFVPKGCELDALQAKIEHVLSEARPAAVTDGSVIEHGRLTIDLRQRRVLVNGRMVPLGPKRFDALCALARSREGLTGKMLSALLSGGEEQPLNTVSKTVTRLRQDLEAVAGEPLIVPIPGGYKLR